MEKTTLSFLIYRVAMKQKRMHVAGFVESISALPNTPAVSPSHLGRSHIEFFATI